MKVALRTPVVGPHGAYLAVSMLWLHTALKDTSSVGQVCPMVWQHCSAGTCYAVAVSVTAAVAAVTVVEAAGVVAMVVSIT